MPIAYFAKEIISNLFYVDGVAVPFEAYAGNSGLIALDPEKHVKIIEALDKAAKEHRGGIVKLSEPQFLEKKSQLGSRSSPRLPPKDVLRVAKQPQFPKSKSAVPTVAAPVKPAPMPVIQERVARLTRSAQASLSEPAGPAPIVEGFRPPTRRIRRTAPMEAPPTSGQ